MSNKKLKIGVVGTGSMGMNHVRIYKELKEIEDIYVFDINPERALKIASFFQVKHANSLEELLVCDGLSISTPTESHTPIATFFLKNGIHCLVEKPVASSYQNAVDLVNTAQLRDTILMVGHVEHFNPAFLQLKKIVKREHVEIYSIDSRRLSYAKPGLDKTIDVISDLMIHDIELIISLIGSGVNKLNSHYVRGPDPWGHVSALWLSDSGALVNVTASRITQTKLRIMNLNTNLGFFHLDFLRQELLLNKSSATQEIIDNGDLIYKLDISSDKILVRNEEPLRAELKHFLYCILNNQKPVVDGEAAAKSVHIADKIRVSSSDAMY